MFFLNGGVANGLTTDGPALEAASTSDSERSERGAERGVDLTALGPPSKGQLFVVGGIGRYCLGIVPFHQ